MLDRTAICRTEFEHSHYGVKDYRPENGESPLVDPFLAALWAAHPDKATPAFKRELASWKKTKRPPKREPELAPLPADRPTLESMLIVYQQLPQRKPLFDPEQRPAPTIAFIIDFLCRRYSISRVELLGQRRLGVLCHARFIGYWLAKKVTGQSLPEIGRRFSRDHTSIMNGIRKINIRREADSDLSHELDEAESALLQAWAAQ